MNKKINLEEIALEQFNGWTHCERIWIRNAMLEFGKQLLELAAENAELIKENIDPDSQKTNNKQLIIRGDEGFLDYKYYTNKQSIINTISHVE